MAEQTHDRAVSVSQEGASAPSLEWTDDGTAIALEEFASYNQLVSTLYRCLRTNEGFQPFFDGFQRHFRCLQGGILGLTHSPIRVIYGWTFGYPEGFAQWFINSDLPEQDEALLRYSALPPRQFDSLAGCDPDIDLLEVVNEDSRAWVAEAELGDSAGMLVSQSEHSQVVFLANRHRSEGNYTRKELLQMNLLAPHIENALAIFHKLYESNSGRETLAMALDRVSKPMVVFNELAQVVQSNAAAEAMLKAHPRLFVSESRESRLQSHNPRFNRELNDAIITAIMNAREGIQDIITLFDQADEERIAVCVTPLSMADDEAQPAAGNYGALAEIVSFQAALPPDLTKLCRLFNCTKAEARTAAHLMQGLSIGEIAREQHLSVHTVRDYVKSLLAKNGYRRQAELVGALVRVLG